MIGNTGSPDRAMRLTKDVGHPAFVREPEVASRRAEFVNQLFTHIL